MNINVFQEFSAANFLAGKMRKTWGRNVEHWETLKDRGNDALKRGDLQSAAELYHQSALSTLGPNQSGIADAFTEVLASWPPDSSRKQLSECTDVLALIMRKLPRPLEDETVTDGSGKVLTASYPHAGAAIAWANHAHVMLLIGDAQQALASARRATKANPEYVKGHYREMRALESLGDSAAAAEIKEEISDYERCRRIFPAEGIALMAVGWISLAQLSFIYMPVRQREVIGSHKEVILLLTPALPPGLALHTQGVGTRHQACRTQSLHCALSGTSALLRLAARIPVS
jgi:tetratricopeptide (TPR) repeat protein